MKSSGAYFFFQFEITTAIRATKKKAEAAAEPTTTMLAAKSQLNKFND